MVQSVKKSPKKTKKRLYINLRLPLLLGDTSHVVTQLDSITPKIYPRTYNCNLSHWDLQLVLPWMIGKLLTEGRMEGPVPKGCSPVRWLVRYGRMSRARKLGSTVRINGLLHLLKTGVDWGYKPLILTFY